MSSAAWWFAAVAFAAGAVMGAAAASVHFLRTFRNDVTQAHAAGRALGHAEGFAQGRQVNEKAAGR